MCRWTWLPTARWSHHCNGLWANINTHIHTHTHTHTHMTIKAHMHTCIHKYAQWNRVFDHAHTGNHTHKSHSTFLFPSSTLLPFPPLHNTIIWRDVMWYDVPYHTLHDPFMMIFLHFNYLTASGGRTRINEIHSCDRWCVSPSSHSKRSFEKKRNKIHSGSDCCKSNCPLI